MRRPHRFTALELALYLLEVPDGSPALNWQAVFGNPNPVEIEVGFGKGLFLLNVASANPAEYL